MNWKKALVILGVIATYPVMLVAGFMIADPFYMRFIFRLCAGIWRSGQLAGI